MAFRILHFARFTICAVTSLISASAYADRGDNAGPSPEQKQHARVLMATGRSARAENRLNDAIDAFRAADEIMHLPPTGLELARSQAALGSLIEAQRTLRRVTLNPESPDEPRQFKEARIEAARLQGELFLRTPVLSLEFSDAGAGRSSHLLVDGVPPEPSELQDGLHINPGHHVIVALSAGRRAVVEVDTVEGESKPAFLDFDTPATRAARANARNRAQLERQARDRASLDSAQSSREISPAVWGLSGLAVAGLATGAAFGLIGRHQHSQLEQLCAPDCSPAANRQVSHMYTVSDVSVVLGLAAAAGAAIAYVAAPSPAAPEVARSVPSYELSLSIVHRLPFATVSGAF